MVTDSSPIPKSYQQSLRSGQITQQIQGFLKQKLNTKVFFLWFVGVFLVCIFASVNVAVVPYGTKNCMICNANLCFHVPCKLVDQDASRDAFPITVMHLHNTLSRLWFGFSLL